MNKIGVTLIELAHLPLDVRLWIMHGELGVSSTSIVERMENMPIGTILPHMQKRTHPYDPDDFRRCQVLLDAVPSYQERLPELLSVGPEWHTVVVHWNDIDRLIEEEVPGYRKTPKKKGKARKAYAYMQELFIHCYQSFP